MPLREAEVPFELAMVLFAIGGFGWLAPVEPYRVKLVSAGLFFYVLASFF